MSGYVIAGYAVTIGGLGGYVLLTLRRLQRLRATSVSGAAPAEGGPLAARAADAEGGA